MAQPRRYRNLLALLWLPPALLIMVPAIILLGLIFYVRAVVFGLAGLFRYFLGYKPSPPSAAVQAPHLFEAGIATQKHKD